MGKIVWLASYPKSGNTWLRAFLHNLLRNPDNAYSINQLAEFCSADSSTGWYSKFDPRPWNELSFEDVAALRPKVHAALSKVHRDSVFVKTHNAAVEDRGVPMITPELTAGAIYVVRNPLDMAISYSHHYGLTIDEAIATVATPGLHSENSETHVYQVYGSWSENVKSWTHTPIPSIHVVRYEDMVEMPQTAFGKVAAFLGLRPPADRLERAIRFSSFDELRNQEDGAGFVERSKKAERFFREGRSGQWRELLTAAQIDAVLSAHKEQMARFGYFPLPSR